MSLTTIPTALEVLNFALVWIMGNSFDYTTKLLLTLAIIFKFSFYYASTICLDDNMPMLRNFLLLACALTNGGIIAFSVITGFQMLMINNAVLLVLLVVWSFLAVFEISWRWGKKE